VTNDALTWKSPTTTSLAWITRKGPDRGIANINIDGVDKGNVDLYAATAQGATITYAGLTSKVHTVVVTVTGTKNAASSGKDVVLDAFTAGTTTAQESDPGVTFGTWKSVANASASGGSYRWASEATASVTVTFTGTAIDWITTKGGNFGKVAITIDGVARGTVDLYTIAQQWQSVVSYAGLGSGSHTLVIQVLDQKNPASGSTKVFVDGFVVHA
jgi:bacillopeptidase F